MGFKDGLMNLVFSLNTIIDDINSRYELLTEIVEYVKKSKSKDLSGNQLDEKNE